jgi:hypothetical protein
MDTYALTIKCGLVKYWDVFNQQWDTKTVQDVQYTQSGSGNFIFPTFSPLDRDRIMAAAKEFPNTGPENTCPECGTATVEDFTDDYDNKAGLSADEVAPIYFDKCPKCAWNNGPGRKKAN